MAFVVMLIFFVVCTIFVKSCVYICFCVFKVVNLCCDFFVCLFNWFMYLWIMKRLRMLGCQ